MRVLKMRQINIRHLRLVSIRVIRKQRYIDSSDKTYSKMLIDYPVGEDNVVLQIYVEQEGVNDLDEVTRAILDNIVVEICMEE